MSARLVLWLHVVAIGAIVVTIEVCDANWFHNGLPLILVSIAAIASVSVFVFPIAVLLILFDPKKHEWRIATADGLSFTHLLAIQATFGH